MWNGCAHAPWWVLVSEGQVRCEEVRRGEVRKVERWHKLRRVDPSRDNSEELRRVGKTWAEFRKSEKRWNELRHDMRKVDKRWEKSRRGKKRWEKPRRGKKRWEKVRRTEKRREEVRRGVKSWEKVIRGKKNWEKLRRAEGREELKRGKDELRTIWGITATPRLLEAFLFNIRIRSTLPPLASCRLRPNWQGLDAGFSVETERFSRKYWFVSIDHFFFPTVDF